MKTASVLALSGLLMTALFFMAPQDSEAALLEDFMISAEKATAFFPGAQASPVANPVGNEESMEVKTPAEAERESTKGPDEVAREALETAQETTHEADEAAEETA